MGSNCELQVNCIQFCFLKDWTLQINFSVYLSPGEQVCWWGKKTVEFTVMLNSSWNSRENSIPFFWIFNCWRYCRFNHSQGICFIASLISLKGVIGLFTWLLPLVIPRMARRTGDYSLYSLFSKVIVVSK